MGVSSGRVMRDNILYLVNPLQQRRHVIRHPDFESAVRQLSALAMEHRQHVRHRRLKPSYSGEKVWISDLRLSQPDGTYWYCSAWRASR